MKNSFNNQSLETTIMTQGLLGPYGVDKIEMKRFGNRFRLVLSTGKFHVEEYLSEDFFKEATDEELYDWFDELMQYFKNEYQKFMDEFKMIKSEEISL